MFSDEESVSSDFSHSDSADEVLGACDYAYCEGKIEDALSPLDISCEEPPTKRMKFVETSGNPVPPLLDLSAQCIAAHLPFEMVERFHHLVKPIPSHLQLDIMKRAFPCDETLIQTAVFLSRRASSFAGCCAEIEREANDETLVVRDAIQTGFTITASIFHRNLRRRERVKKASILLHFDRQRITSATCSVHRKRWHWCSHVVRLVFTRMRHPWMFRYRLPISYCLEQLDLAQHKQLIQNMLSDQPLEFLSRAQKILDDLVEEDRPFLTSNIIPDSTAGAGATDEGVWHVDETSLRRVFKDHAERGGLSAIGRSCARYEIGSRPSSLSEWGGWLASLPDKGRAVEHDEIGETCWSWMSEIEIYFQIIRRLLKKGEELAVRVLSVFTRQWLYMLETVVTTKTSLSDNVVDQNSNYPNNISLFTCAFPSCLACRLISYWRLAVMNPLYNADVIDRIRKHHKHWAERFDRIVAAGALDCRAQGLGCVQERARQVHVIHSFEGWNGFRHVYAWTSPSARMAIENAVKSEFSSSKVWDQLFDADGTDAGLKLATVACISRGLRFYGYAAQSIEIAVQAFQSMFSLNLSHPGVKHRSKRVKRKNTLADLTVQIWKTLNIPLSWSLGVLLEEVCIDDDAWKRFPDVSNVIAGKSLNQFATASQPTIVFPLPLYLCVYFCTVRDEYLDCFYASATQVSSANEIIDSILHQSEEIANRTDYLCEIGQFLSASISAENFNFARYSRMLLQASLNDSSASFAGGPMHDMLATGISEQAVVVSKHIGGQGSDDQFYYVVTQYGSLLYELLNRYSEDEAATAAIIRQALDPIKKHISEPFSSNFDGIMAVAASLTVRTSSYKRLIDFVMDVLDVANLACGFSTRANRWLTSRCEHLHLIVTRFTEVRSTLKPITITQNSLKGGVLLHIKLLSLTKTLEDARLEQLSVVPKLLRLIGTGALVELLWSFGWEGCFSQSELLHCVLLLEDFVASCQKPLSQSTCQALCSLMIEAACAITWPVICGDFFNVVEKLGCNFEHRFVTAIASLCQRRIPAMPYYCLFRLARTRHATFQECLDLAVAGYQRLWAYCHAGSNLECLLTDQRVDSSLLSDIHNLASLSLSCGKIMCSTDSTVGPVLQLVMDAWIDPFVSFNVLAEIARLHDLPDQYLTYKGNSNVSKCWNEPVDCLKSLIKAIPLCSEMVERCKRDFISLLTGDRSVRGLMSLPGDIDKEEIFRQHPMPCDLICLDIILETSPDSNVSIPDISEQCKKFWLDHGAELENEFTKRKERSDFDGTTRLQNDPRHFYYRRILEVNVLQPWQLPVADVLLFSSQSSEHSQVGRT